MSTIEIEIHVRYQQTISCQQLVLKYCHSIITQTTPECSIHNVSIPALSIKDPDCHGYIWKQGEHHKTWKRRYSVLKNGSLYYYKDMSETTALGVFNMHCYTVNETESTNRKFGLIAIPPQPSMRTFYFAAETDTDRER